MSEGETSDSGETVSKISDCKIEDLVWFSWCFYIKGWIIIFLRSQFPYHSLYLSSWNGQNCTYFPHKKKIYFCEIQGSYNVWLLQGPAIILLTRSWYAFCFEHKFQEIVWKKKFHLEKLFEYFIQVDLSKSGKYFISSGYNEALVILLKYYILAIISSFNYFS